MPRDRSLLSPIERGEVEPLESPLERSQRSSSRRVPARPATLSDTGSAGATVIVPGAGGAVDLFSGFAVGDLDATARAQPGWCFRVGYPSDLPARPDEFTEWGVLDLIVELRATAGGIEQTVELDAFPGFAFHVAADQISARMRCVNPEARIPENYQAVWSVTRGMCTTTATRSFDVGGGVESAGNVPPFATSFGLYSGDSLSGLGGLSLNFRHSLDSVRLVHDFTNDELLGVIGGAHARIPPCSRVWRWTNTAAPVFRLTFGFGAFEGGAA